MAKVTLDELRARLRARGLRATPSRLAVLELLLTNPSEQAWSHAEVVAELAPGPWDPATIYRNLTDLVEAGLARRTDVGDHVWRVEALDGKHDSTAHPHFVCTECGTVECLPVMKALVSARMKAPRALKQQKVEVQVRGLCDACS